MCSPFFGNSAHLVRFKQRPPRSLDESGITEKRFSGNCDLMRVKTSPLVEIACVLVRLDHVARFIVTEINGLKIGVWADLFVTLGFGSLSQVAMGSALRVFTRGMFGFAEIIVIVTLVCLLAAIALLNSFAVGRRERADGVATASSSPQRIKLVRGDNSAKCRK
jgi:hypothetical protein